MLEINTNVASIIAQNAVSNTQNKINTSVQRLATGLRINSAQDDAAGLGIAARMTSQVNGINQAVLNANYGVSLAQTAQGALSAVSSALQRVRQLAVESANASNSATDRSGLDAEAQQLISQVQTIATQTQFNGQNILDGTFGIATFQVGANAGQTLTAATGNIQTSSLGSYSSVGTALPGGGGTALAGPTSAGDPGDLAITGANGKLVKIGATNDGQASTISAAINAQSANTGVTAIATTTTNLTITNTALAAGDLAIKDSSGNNVNVGAVAAASTAGAFTANLASQINAISAKTGVTATYSGNQLTLSNTTGADITLEATSTGQTVSGLSGASTSVGGTISLSSGSAFSIGGGAASKAGLASPVSTMNTLASSDISTATNATTMVQAVDGALAQINNLQANIGAMQARFQSVVSTLQTQSQNLSAARSSVQDTDFAAETANLSKEQVMQQAGTAMVAQAHQQASQVLTLLQKLG